jgi:hypothetical protein
VEGEAMDPIPLTSVAYAFRAGSAERFDGDVSWGQLIDLPTGFADGSDDGASYAAGPGLTLAGDTFAVDTGAVQSRVSGTCPSGQSIRGIAADGTVTCEVDDIGTPGTTYMAGSGLTLTGTTFAVDPGLVQARVSGSCPAGQSIRAIASDGTVLCELDDSGAMYLAGSGLTLTGTTFAADPSAIQARVTGTCAAGQSIRAIAMDGTVTCEVDDAGTPYSAGTGLTLTGTTFAVDPSTVQARVGGSCPAGQAIRAVAADGTVTCEPSGSTSLLTYGHTPATAGQSCRDIKAMTPWSADGVYWIDPDGGGPINRMRVLCDMTRDGGGWTFILKNRYTSGIAGRAGGFGTLDDLDYHQSDFYKIDDSIINAIIGDGTFDILADQKGFNSAYSNGNHEYVIVRNYTATFTFTALVPESSTTTVFESYRSSDNLLVWRGRLQCGASGGVGVNCLNILSTPSPVGTANPQGGAGCLYPLGASTNVGWHHFYMSETNTDTYLYICNGAQHSSSYDMSHQWWVR